VVTPQLRAQDATMPRQPWVPPDNFNPGYLARGMAQLPQQGTIEPWIHTQDYDLDRKQLPAADLEDGTLVYR